VVRLHGEPGVLALPYPLTIDGLTANRDHAGVLKPFTGLAGRS